MQSRKRVVVDTFCLSFEKTGIKTYTQELVAGLRDHQSDSCEYSLSLSLSHIDRLSFLSDWRNGNLRLVFHFVYFVWKQVLLPLLLLFRKADVVVCPDFIAPFFTPFLLKVPVIHDAFLWQSPEHFGRSWSKWYLWMLMNGLSGKSVVVTTSGYSKVSLEAYLKKSIQVVYQSFIRAPTKKKSADPPVNSPYILHVGLIEERKSLDTLVNAFALFVGEIDSPYQLIMVGRSENDQIVCRLKSIADSLNISDRIILTGYASNQDLARFYQHASMYVFPSSNEGFGIPVLEAMHQRVPVIVSNSGALEEISGGAALVFETNNEYDLKEKMLFLHQNEQDKEQLVKLGVERCKHFTRKKFTNSLEKVILRHINS